MDRIPTAEHALDPAVSSVSLRIQHPQELVRVPLEPLSLRWSWVTTGGERVQVGYQLRTRHRHYRGDMRPGEWAESPAVATAEATATWELPPETAARAAFELSIRIATDAGWSRWSDGVHIEFAPEGADLAARMIGIASEVEGPAPVLGTEIRLAGRPEAARLVITALGTYEARINGQIAHETVLGPGWTSYDQRILVETHDVTAMMRDGLNDLSVEVADGWFRGRMGFAGRRAIYGSELGVLAQLEVFDAGAWRVVAASDDTWTGGFGELRSASIYDGTVIDRRRRGESGRAAAVLPTPGVLEPSRATGVKPVECFEVTPVPRSDGPLRIDVAQNISGWVRLRVRGPAGAQVTVRHAEVLDETGALYTAALRTAKATDHYILDGGEAVLEPRHTFHGFRYADIVCDSEVEVIQAQAIAVSSVSRERAEFACSDARLERFHENVRWSQLDNFVSIPTDCPQRDERLGWTGDAQAFAATAARLFDSEAFLANWLRDLAHDQSADGAVPAIVPNILEPGDMQAGGEPAEVMGRAGWADAATVVPVALYREYGDPVVLRTQIESMRAWVDHLRRRAGGDLLLPPEPFEFGDWLDPDAPGDRPWEAKAPADLVSNAFYVWSVRLLGEAEEALGERARAAEAFALADRTANELWDQRAADFLASPTGAALAIALEIAPGAQRTAVGARLAEMVRERGGRISTGFLGTPHVLDALSATGHLDEAYLMLMCEEIPSWLYQVTKGATTVWERWDAIGPDGVIHDGAMDSKEGDSMLSFNHYAYGAVADWVHRHVGGLSATAPGYAGVRIAPRPGGGLSHASIAVDTDRGRISVGWELLTGGAGEREMVIRMEIPTGVTAALDLPVSSRSMVILEHDNEGPQGRVLSEEKLEAGSYLVRVSHPVVVGD